MFFEVVPYVSTIVKNRFPRFYEDEGPNFIAFLNAYYEWMQATNNPLYYSRKLPSIQDIDTTLTQFLTHFQNEYLYGMPINSNVDPRFIIKHVKDVYFNKGTSEGFKLLFRLLYNADIDIYIPKVDMLRVSDGTWIEPRYLEVSDNGNLPAYVNKIIQGTGSGAQAFVTDFYQQTVNGKIVNILFLSNISGQFIENEKIFDTSLPVVPETLQTAPKILGSLTDLMIISGGRNFNVGDIIQSINSSGTGAQFRVASTANGQGTLLFNIDSPGTLYSTNTTIILTRVPSNTGTLTGHGGAASVGSIDDITAVTYNSDFLQDYANVALNASDYGFHQLLATNSSSALNGALTFNTGNFGSIATLADILSGNNYQLSPTVTALDLLLTKAKEGTAFWANTSNVVTGVGTSFTFDFSVGSVIYLVKTPGGSPQYQDYRVVTAVANNTYMTVDDYPTTPDNNGAITSVAIAAGGTLYQNTDTIWIHGTGAGTGASITLTTNSSGGIASLNLVSGGINFTAVPTLTVNTTTGSGASLTCTIDQSAYYVAIPLMWSNFTNNVIGTSNGSTGGENATISANPQFGSGIIATVQLRDSGFGYFDGDILKFATYGALNTPSIIAAGNNYANNDSLVFAGGAPVSEAIGTVLTNGNGNITSINMIYPGSGYQTAPTVSVISAHGTGAVINATIGGLNTTFIIEGVAVKSGIGQQSGHWLDNSGFLNDTKYIQDSFYYQDFSYELQVPLTLDRYKNMVTKVFHPAGTELFGKVLNLDVISTANLESVYDSYTLVANGVSTLVEGNT